MAGIGALPAAEVLGVYIHASTGSTGTDFVTWTWTGAVNNKYDWQVSAEDKPKGFTHVPSLDLYDSSCPENTLFIAQLAYWRNDLITVPAVSYTWQYACMKSKFTGLIPRRIPGDTLIMFSGKEKIGGIIFKTVAPSIPKARPVAQRKLAAGVVAPSQTKSRDFAATV
jgi:hypothetical protein